MMTCGPDPNRTWEGTPLPDSKYECPNCEETMDTSWLFWVMVDRRDDTEDDWYCLICCGELAPGKEPGITLWEALEKRLK